MKSSKRVSRFGRISLAILLGFMVWASAPPAAWARPAKSDNTSLTGSSGPDFDPMAYILVIAGMMTGVAVVCRRSYRSGEPK